MPRTTYNLSITFKCPPWAYMHIPHYLWIRHLVISILRSFAKGEEINLFKKIASFVPTFIKAYVGKLVGIFTCLDYLVQGYR